MNSPEEYMQRCLQLAALGLGNVAPNPMVGCIIVHDGKIIGEGFHQKFGEAHAEVNAINAVVQKHGEEILSASQLYVSLEPCTHHGKTPPCVDLIIAKKIPEVYIGCLDPFPEVNGGGVKKLQQSGVKVQTGILENECKAINKRFFTYQEKKRPYIILKWAQSADQFIAAKDTSEDNRWISNEFSRKLTHKWRTEEQSILVGSNTVTADNPRLSSRDWIGKHPLRVVIDPLDSLDHTSAVFDNSVPTLVFNESKKMLKENTEWIAIDFSKNQLSFIVDQLYARKIQSVIIEGGAFTLKQFIMQNLWDEARIFIADKFLNDGVKAPQIDFTKKITEERILDDNLYILINKDEN
jgi:diaminohydroxyphosphoribosylaminopyrimidine deaminase/5-amino-6-(5-phosphoribosylamino)uracil reductase